MKHTLAVWALVLGTLGICAGLATAQNLDRVSSSEKGSLVIFPKVELRWDAEGNLLQDTFLDLTNDSLENVQVQMYFINGDPPLTAGQIDCPDGCLNTTAEDFRTGNSVNVIIPGDFITLPEVTEPFPFICMALSGRGTLTRLDTETGQAMGEYRTAPLGRALNPSRTTVDQYGNVWAGNRDEAQNGMGSVVKVGVVVGGTRVNADGTPNPAGDYLAPPFDYNTCVDRDSDGLIATSRGLFDVRAWPAGTDGAGGPTALVEDALDECILVYQRVHGSNARHVSITGDNDVWVGGYGADNAYDLLDGDTGQILNTVFPACGGYGGLTDGNGVVWSADLGRSSLLRFDPATNATMCIPMSGSYGLGIDPAGYIWNSTWTNSTIAKLDPAGNVLPGFPKSAGPGGCYRGVAVTPVDSHVWTANSCGNTVSRLDNNGNLLKVIPVGSTPTGVAVDAAGKVWVTNYGSSDAMRIDPNAGGDGLGAVDLTVALGAGATPYNYSDMTGLVALQTAQQGSWSKVCDSQVPDQEWGTVTWNTESCVADPVPPGTSLTVEVRAADTPAGLPAAPWRLVENGVPFSNVRGQYIEVRARLLGAADPFAAPTLCDIAVRPICERPHFGYNNVDAGITLTANQPYYWSVATGQSGAGFPGVQPFTVLDPGDPPGRPDPEGSLERVLRGFVIAYAVDAQGKEVKLNHLKGDALLVNYARGYAWEYNAFSFAADQVNGDFALDLNGREYDQVFGDLLLDFYATGAELYSAATGIQILDTDLTLLPLGALDLREGGRPASTKAEITIWNMNEQKLSGSYKCLTFWDQAVLSRYPLPNQFTLEVLGTDKGKARIEGIQNGVCPESAAAPLLGVAARFVAFLADGYTPPPDGLREVAAAGSIIPGIGYETGQILTEGASDPPEQPAGEPRPTAAGGVRPGLTPVPPTR